MGNIKNNDLKPIIEVLSDTYFPVSEVSEEAIKEKKGRSPIYHMHFYWGRKPLVAARAAILSASLLKSDNHQLLRHLGLDTAIADRKRRSFNHSPDIEKLKEHYKTVFGKTRPVLLDPFAGGGSIPYEGLRLGFDVIACEYNPVAWSILKAILEFPKKFGKVLIDRIQRSFTELADELEVRIGHLYPKQDNYISSTFMYAWGVTCPFCKIQTPLVNNWVLKKKLNKNSTSICFDWTYMAPSIENGRLMIEIIEVNGVVRPKNLLSGTVIRGKAICFSCKNIISNKHIVSDIRENKFEFPLVIVQIQIDKKGKRYIPFDSDNLKIWEKRKDFLGKIDQKILPEFSMPLRIVPAARYLGSWDQLANERQRYFFYEFILVARIIANQKSKEWGEEWGKAVALYFSLLLGKSVDFNTRCTSWASKEGIRNSLAFRRPSMVWDHCEINPFSPKGSGNLKTTMKNILDGIKQACHDLKDTPGNVEIVLGSMLQADLPQADLIVTDPPYADDVQYPELSEFFYAWEQAILIPFFPHLPKGSPPNSEDLSANNMDRKQEFVEFGLSLAFSKIKQLLHPKGRLALFFAHGSLDVWSFVINALIDAGFIIMSTFPVHTESRDNVIALGKASFMTSTLIYATHRKEDRIAYYEEIEDDIKEYAQEIIRSFIELGFRGSDLTMAALGPVLKKISEYSEIKSISGTLDLTDVLRLTSNILLDQILGSSVISSVDSITRGYLYSRLSGLKIMSHDVFQLLAKSLGINLDKLRNSTIFIENLVGKEKSYILRNFQNREKMGNSLIDQIHKGFRAFEEGGSIAFWKEIDEDEFIVKEVLKLINHGIDRGKLAPEFDPDSNLAQQLCRIIT